jgi:hypothetical protein
VKFLCKSTTPWSTPSSRRVRAITVVTPWTAVLIAPTKHYGYSSKPDDVRALRDSPAVKIAKQIDATAPRASTAAERWRNYAALKVKMLRDPLR